MSEPPRDAPGGREPVPMVGPLEGIAGSPGIVVAVALVLEQGKGSVPRRTILSSEKEAELGRFRDAVEEAQFQIGEVHGRVADALPEEHLKILEAYQSMLGDPNLAQAVHDEVVVKGRNAEWAVEVALQGILRQFDALDDPYLRERRHDVEFVGERLMRALVTAQPVVVPPKAGFPTAADRRATIPLKRDRPGRSVLVGHDLSPADTAAMVRDPIVGFVTEVGTRTSHTSIMARALEIPAVVGVTGIRGHVRTGDLIVVDGLRGQVWVRPSPDVIARARARGERFASRTQVLRSRHREPATLSCGTRISLLANVELPAEAILALEHGAEGIGLYRTEFLYIDRKELPTEDEQYELFRNIVQLAAPRPVTLRTFDLGNDKLATKVPVPDEANPALGTRAVRLALREPELFSVQLRAMARAAAHGDVRVMIPMVSNLEEIRAVRKLLDRALADLVAQGKPHRKPALGVMIEVPSAAICADLFAREADFFSLGTNDLVQYALAADRGSHELARLASSFDPSILRLIRMTAKAATDADIPVSVCGAMASDPLAAVLLVGMGVRSLSMEAAAIVEIKEALRRFSLEECEGLAAECRALATAAEVEMALAESVAPRLSDLLGGEDLTIPPPFVRA